MFSERYELNFKIVNSCILHIKRNRKYISLEVFHEIVAEGLLMDVGARNSGTAYIYFCRQNYWK
jgi:hypothetical protein